MRCGEYFSMEKKNPHGFKTYLISIANETKNMAIRQDQLQIFRMSTPFRSGWNLPVLSTGSDCDAIHSSFGQRLDYILPLRFSAGPNY